MGVDTEVWRARIGQFRGSPKTSRFSSNCERSACLPLLVGALILHFMTLAALLIIGNIESNPGPVFHCQVCDSKLKFHTFAESILHQKSHISDKNFHFMCPWPTCGLQFMSFNALNMHGHYAHHHARNIPQTETTPRVCIVPECNFSFPSNKLLCQHLMKDHQDQGVKTQCPFKMECLSEHFFPKSSFSVHLSQKHKGWNLCSTTPIELTGGPSTSVIASNVEVDVSVSDTDDYGMDIGSNDVETETVSDNVSHDNKLFELKEEFYRGLAMLYLRLESLHLLPISTVQVIADSLAQLTETNLSILRETVSKELGNLDLTEEVKGRMMINILSGDCMFAAHHKDTERPSMRTNALRKTYYRSHFKYVIPREINISRDPNNRRCIYYVDIEKSLELFLSHPEVIKELSASFSRVSKDGILEDFKDGSLHKKRSAKHEEKSIDLIIFQDEFVPTKDLSSVANSHKLLGMYMTVGNLSPHLRSKLDCKRLIMLIPDSKAMYADFKVSLFRKVVKELKRLENHPININGDQLKVRLRFLVGDNKGQHEIGGFIQSFSSEYFCRYCPMTKTEIKEQPWKVAPLRTPESYEEASLLVPADRATYMGVSRPEFHCPFNKLEDFHVCDPSLAPCVAHDLFEGVINYDLSLIFQQLVQDKWFTYDQLNRKIRCFKYVGQDSGNKPAPVKYDKKKKTGESSLGHAVQNWTLLRLLPFILAEEFIKDQDHEHWKLYLMLKKITESVCTPSISLVELSRMKVLVENYLVKRKGLLGDGKPKHHYLAHYADLFELLGPLFHLNTLGFEQFHQFFKTAAKMGKNFINLGHTLVKKYCMYLAYLSAGSPFVTGVRIVDPGVTVAMKRAISRDESLEFALSSRDIDDQALIMNSIFVDEILFKEGQWLLLGNHSETEIVVAKIRCVVLNRNSVFLMLEKRIATYLSDIGIHTVSDESCGLSCIPRSDIMYPTAQSMYEWGSFDLCFSLKNTLTYDAPR